MKEFLSKLANKQNFAGVLFILPSLLGTIVFIIIPIVCSFGLSFAKWDLLNPIQFVGLENYKVVLTEPVFVKIIINTIVYAISTSVFGVIIPLILACIINNKIKGADFFKTAYFLPFVTPMIVIGIIFNNVKLAVYVILALILIAFVSKICLAIISTFKSHISK